MAGSLLMLLDDIVAVLDDVALMTKMAAKKTAGVVGDDLALNAQQIVSGQTASERELPIVGKVALGSLVNKALLIPLALFLSATFPALITPLMMLGGGYLCYEGVEKVWHTWAHRMQSKQTEQQSPEIGTLPDAPQTSERDKIWGAIKTDFILSAEIMILALGVVQDKPLMVKALVLSAIGIGMTVLVYGLVAVIVKVDDVGLAMTRRYPEPHAMHKLGLGLIAMMPWVMRGLSIIGTVAMFLVGGSIFTHVPAVQSAVGSGMMVDLLVGIAVGVVTVLLHHGWTKLRT